MQKEPLVLMLEEDPDDRQLTESALLELGFDIPVTYVSDSDELFDHLKHRQRPALIMLDYNSTPAPALEILKALKASDEYRSIPAVVLGEGLPAVYVRQCYDHGASSYITKPASVRGTREKIAGFFRYWLNVAETT
ncbi:MAG TPA: response regulator [Chitinophagaceae bacterium]